MDALIDAPSTDATSAATAYVCEGFEDEKKVLEGARAILVDRCATNADLVGGGSRGNAESRPHDRLRRGR